MLVVKTGVKREWVLSVRKVVSLQAFGWRKTSAIFNLDGSFDLYEDSSIRQG